MDRPKTRLPIWLLFAMIPPSAIVFVLGAVWGMIIIEHEVSGGAALLFVAAYWTGFVALGVSAFRSVDWT